MYIIPWICIIFIIYFLFKSETSNSIEEKEKNELKAIKISVIAEIICFLGMAGII